MQRLLTFVLALSFCSSFGQVVKENEESLLKRILTSPSTKEIEDVLADRRRQDLLPQQVMIHDSVDLANTNRVYILSHRVNGHRHYGAVVAPTRSNKPKLPVIIFATGGDGMHSQFDFTQDFSHKAVQFPNFLGGDLDNNFMIVIPAFRGQQLIIGDKKYQSEGEVADAFDGATTDALAFLNVALQAFKKADQNRIMIYGGSRGGTVALLASARDRRIKRAVVVAAPADITGLYNLYPDQFKLLFFNDLLTGKISEREARKKFIASSPIYFTKELPPVQLHHDRNDPFVPVAFAEKLISTMKANGRSIVPYFYDESIHGFWSDERYWQRVQEFVREISQ